MTREQQAIHRIKVSLLCEVTWKAFWLRGRIADIARTGALVVEVGAVPPVGEEVLLAFQVEREEDPGVAPVREVSCTVLRTGRDFLVQSGMGYFAVGFDPIEAPLWEEILESAGVRL